jgi:exosome complex component RRP46
MAQLNPLDGADGSAKYTAHGYTIIAAVNGPIQVMRRDELPEEAVVEINVRPAVGVGSRYIYIHFYLRLLSQVWNDWLE